ncbi:fasciclin domain-containing protein [Nonomuraea sp. NPDC049784]|uniref:fasciclin domain-containing protein n=1 Tax=Nonomuraea sp. NPDC049784 TaxID=3154361 RepID=UPI0033F4CBD5
MKRVLLAAALALTASTAGTAHASVYTPTPETSPSPETSMPETSPAPEETSSMPEVSPSPTESPSAGASPFGPGCASMQSSLPGIADKPVATALSQVTELSMFSDAVKKAGLEEKLNSAKDITVFAPDNKAFDAIPKEIRDKLMADKDVLAKLVKYHVVEGKKAPADLAGATLKTMQGRELSVKGSGEDLTINGAKIVCGDVHTSNAVVYVVDKVLKPQ